MSEAASQEPTGFFWTELNCADTAAAREYCAETYGWTFVDSSTESGGEYWFALENGKPIAGLLPRPDGYEEADDFWVPYFAVEDVDAACDVAVKKGAKIIRPLWDVPDTGRRVVLKSPSGDLIALMTPFSGR